MVNWIVAFTTPIFLEYSSYGVYFLFGCSSLLVVIVAILFMPETRGKTLEEIDAAFRRPQTESQGNRDIELDDALVEPVVNRNSQQLLV